MKIIGVVRSGFTQKFGIPRQSGLGPNLTGTLEIAKEFADPDWWRGIEDFSHLWFITHLHHSDDSKTSPVVRPPRLGGNAKLGVFATRSPMRPNPLGLSLVENKGLVFTDKGTLLHFSNHDLLDGTPIFDIKPYIKEVDAHVEATDGWIQDLAHKEFKVEIPSEVLMRLSKLIPDHLAREIFLKAIEEILRFDIRPRYKKTNELSWFTYQGIDLGFTQEAESLFKVTGIKSSLL